MTTNDIGKTMGYNLNTICRWLKQGNKLGWCHYDVDEEIKKNNNKQSIRNKKSKSQSIEIFKDQI
jgi:hypothetical protein